MSKLRIPQIVEAKTSAYTVTDSDFGKLLTNRGASASVTFTLPTATAANSGCWVEFYTCAAQPIVLSPATADTLVVHADLTADTLTTASTIGQHLTTVSDGTGWLVISDPSAATTATAVTAVVLAS